MQWQRSAAGWPVGVWGTDGKFVYVDEARTNHLMVASANWNALATFAAKYVPEDRRSCIDIGSTTTDIVYMPYGEPEGYVGMTDADRLLDECLIYTGVRRTPICSLPVSANRVRTIRDDP